MSVIQAPNIRISTQAKEYVPVAKSSFADSFRGLFFPQKVLFNVPDFQVAV